MRVVAKDYQELIAALSRRRRELHLTLADLDEWAGLADRHSSKILGPTPTKFLGPVSLSCLLGALGLRIVITDDPIALAKVQDRLRRRSSLAHPVSHKTGTIAAGELAGELNTAAGI